MRIDPGWLRHLERSRLPTLGIAYADVLELYMAMATYICQFSDISMQFEQNFYNSCQIRRSKMTSATMSNFHYVIAFSYGS